MAKYFKVFFIKIFLQSFNIKYLVVSIFLLYYSLYMNPDEA